MSVLAPVDVAVANAAEEEAAAAAAAAQPPVAVASHAVAEAHVAAPVTLAAPSPRKTDALLGLELLSRSASINEKDGTANIVTDATECTDSMEANDGAASAETTDDAPSDGSAPSGLPAAGSASNGSSSASSMVIDQLAPF